MNDQDNQIASHLARIASALERIADAMTNQPKVQTGDSKPDQWADLEMLLTTADRGWLRNRLREAWNQFTNEGANPKDWREWVRVIRAAEHNLRLFGPHARRMGLNWVEEQWKITVE